MVLSLEGYIVDDEVIGWVKRALDGCRVDEERLALDLIAAQGPGGQFIQVDHTLHYFRREMWIPTLSDRAATVTWMEEGGLDVRDRARSLIRERLGQYEPLSLPADMRERLQGIIDKSVKAGKPAVAS